MSCVYEHVGIETLTFPFHSLPGCWESSCANGDGVTTEEALRMVLATESVNRTSRVIRNSKNNSFRAFLLYIFENMPVGVWKDRVVMTYFKVEPVERKSFEAEFCVHSGQHFYFFAWNWPRASEVTYKVWCERQSPLKSLMRLLMRVLVTRMPKVECEAEERKLAIRKALCRVIQKTNGVLVKRIASFLPPQRLRLNNTRRP